MKTYIFTKEYKKNSYGCTVTAKVYRVKNNIPEYVTKVIYNTGSYRGHESEVFCELINIGEIPQSYYNLSKNDYSGGGYYCEKVKEKGIQIIEL